MVINAKSSDNAQLALDLDQGPNGRDFAPHSTPTSTTQLNSDQSVVIGDADTSKILAEYLQVTLTASGTTGADEWIDVDVYQTLKPF